MTLARLLNDRDPWRCRWFGHRWKVFAPKDEPGVWKVRGTLMAPGRGVWKACSRCHLVIDPRFVPAKDSV